MIHKSYYFAVFSFGFECSYIVQKKYIRTKDKVFSKVFSFKLSAALYVTGIRFIFMCEAPLAKPSCLFWRACLFFFFFFFFWVIYPSPTCPHTLHSTPLLPSNRSFVQSLMSALAA